MAAYKPKDEVFYKGQLVIYLGQWLAQIVGLSKTGRRAFISIHDYKDVGWHGKWVNAGNITDAETVRAQLVESEASDGS